RPQGDRVIDAPYVFVDIPAFINQLKDEKTWEKNDRNGITVFKGGDVTIVISALQKGAVIKDNMVNGFISVQVLNGKLRIATPDGDVNAIEQNMIAFHPGIAHSIEALSDAVLLITHYGKTEAIL